MRKVIGILILCVLSLGASSITYAATFPSRPISVINPFLPGGIVDLCWRPVSDEMSKALNQTIVNNVTPGAGGVMGITKFATGKASAYNILLCSDGTFIASSRLRKVRYNVDDYVSLGAFAQPPSSLAGHKNETRWTDLLSFVAYAKAHPGELSIGLTGMMSQGHIAVLMIIDKLGIDVKIVPFDGDIACVGAVASKHIDLAYISMAKNDAIKVLALLGDRTSLYPNVPTFKELGYDIYWVNSWGLYVHKNVPVAEREILTAALLKGAAAPSSKELITNLAHVSVVLGPDVTNKFMTNIKSFIDAQIAAGKLVPEK